VRLEDAGGGAGAWTASFEPDRAAGGSTVAVPGQVNVPGTFTLELRAASQQGEVGGVLVLRRDGVTRRIPVWGRITVSRLGAGNAPILRRPGVYAGNTRGHPARVDTYRYPDVPDGSIVTSLLRGPEQVFRVVLRRPVANIGVAIISRAPGVRVEPRLVADGDENRLTGYAALPFDLNPYVDEFEDPVLAAGAILPAPGTYAVVFDSASRAGAGTFRFRFWVDDTTPPTARLVGRTVAAPRPVRFRVSDAGAGVDPRSLEASIDGRTVTARLVANEVRIPTRGIASGRHHVRLSVADYQETRNMENVARILPNTRVVTASVTVRPGF